MSHEGSMERSAMEQEEKKDSASSSAKVVPVDAESHDAKPSASVDVPAAVREPSSEAPAGRELLSSYSLGYGASQATLESVTLVPSASSSKQQESEASAPPLEPSDELRKRSRRSPELPTSPPATKAVRSLTLLMSPRRQHQEQTASLKVKLTSSHDGQPGTPEEVPVSPKSQGTPSTKNSFSSSVLDSLPLDAPQANPPAQSVRSSSEELLQKVAQPAMQRKSSLPGGPSIPTAAADRTRSITMAVRAETSGQSRAVLSPRVIVPRSDTPRRLENRRETTEVAQEPLSPTSPASVASPNSLPSPRRRSKPSFSHLLRDETYVPPRVPWTTLVVTWLQLQSHWNFIHKHYPERCASVETLIDGGEWARAPLAAFHHENWVHLATNLVSFFLRALVLEAAFGTTYFAAVLTVAVLLVGLLNTFIAAVAFQFIAKSWLRTTCSHTFAGVIIALDMLARKHFTHSVVHCGTKMFKIWPLVSVVIESFSLVMFSYKNFLPIVSGVLVGAVLAHTAVGNFLISVRYPRQHLHLCVFPKAPVTFFFAVSIIAAYLYGPYTELPAAMEPALTFRYPVWGPSMLRILYLPDVFMMVYVVLSLLPVAVQLEQDIGHYRFFVLVPGLLFTVNTSLDMLSWIIWKHLIAFKTELPPPTPHSLSCWCGLTGVLLALKAIHHMWHPRSDYQMASFPVPLPFWPGLLVELAHLGYTMPQGSTFGHVTGVFIGLAIGHCRSEYFENCIPGVGSFSASSTPLNRYHHVDC